MLLTKLTARNFRLLEAFDLDLSANVTVLVGPNNSGKSNVIDVMRFIDQATKQNIQNAYFERMGFEKIVTRGEIQKVIILELDFSDGIGQLRHRVILDSAGLMEEVVTIGSKSFSQTRSGHDFTNTELRESQSPINLGASQTSPLQAHLLYPGGGKELIKKLLLVHDSH